MNDFYFVYVLFSEKDHKFYIGYTKHLKKRVEQHNAGLTLSTAPRRPLELIFFEGHRIKEDALRRERYFKTTSGKKTLRIVLKEYIKKRFHRPSLA